MGLYPFRTKGIKIPADKETAGMGIMPMVLPSEVHIPMRQGRGDAAEPVALPGDYVRLGQLIGRSVSYSSVPVHSSVSGTVIDVRLEPSQQGGEDIHIVIQPDGRQDIAPTVIPPVIKSGEDFIEAVRASGMIGLGGAGYPLAAKLGTCLEHKVDTLIINGCECEPYLTADQMTMMAHGQDLLDGARAIMKWLGIEKCIIGISNSMKDVLEHFEDHLQDDAQISVKRVRNRYPLGSEQIIVGLLTGRKVLPGRIPADVGCLVCNVNTVVKLRHYLATGLPLVTKNVTVDGNALFSRRNVEVPIGTRISDIMNFCGGPGNCKPALILLDGVMMGHSVPDTSYPVTKLNNAVLFFEEKFARGLEPTACIRCGRCVKACPMDLMPGRIADLLDKNDVKALAACGTSACMNCGACSYVCPARRRLSQKVMTAAELVKSRKNDTGKEAPNDER